MALLCPGFHALIPLKSHLCSLTPCLSNLYWNLSTQILKNLTGNKIFMDASKKKIGR